MKLLRHTVLLHVITFAVVVSVLEATFTTTENQIYLYSYSVRLYRPTEIVAYRKHSTAWSLTIPVACMKA
jgi:hypothetical protein